MSNSSRGNEREAFIDTFLAEVLPPIYRFGTGDATDVQGNRSGQLDVVVEYPVAPSLPSVGKDRTRLYLSESIAAVIEVKSNASSQWDQACKTAEQLAPLRRSFGSTMVMGGFPPQEQIPLFVVGYTGWSKIETLQSKLAQQPHVSRILIVENQLFATQHHLGGLAATGPYALWGLITSLHLIANSLQAASTNPFEYIQQ
ncbi:MAG: DUF6602 domain-containing protein [Pseudomonadota bacterium]